MNIRLHSLLQEAEARLAAADQDRLADLVQAFVATHDGPVDFDESELAHLAVLDSEPFDPADPADIAALFKRRG